MNTTPPALFTPFQLPCGIQLKNRIIKAAMSDSLGDGAGNPTEPQINLYRRWAQGGIAASIIGEVQSDPRYPEKPGNLVLGDTSDTAAFTKLTKHATANNAHIWAQLGNAGALTHPPVGIPKGPSRLDLPGLSCGELSTSEITQLPHTYARAATLAQQFGFGGIEIHAAHGFLLGQFLSPLFNRRGDQYGGDIAGRMRILLDIIAAVRDEVRADFAIALKINSSDQLEGGLSEDESLQVIAALDKTGIDLIDISGGTYFPGAKSSSDRRSGGPYFVEYAKQARKRTSIPLMATGGFARKQQAQEAIASGAIDFVGIARALALEPSLADLWQAGESDPTFPRFDSPPPGGITAWYSMRLTAIGENRENNPDTDLATALRDYEARDKAREPVWNKAFEQALKA